MNKRQLPRFRDRERIGIFAVADKKLLAEAETVDLSIKGVCFESEADFEVREQYYIVFGYLRINKLEVLSQILTKYQKNNKQCYSARFLEDDVLRKNKIRSYVEAIRIGKY
jgi:hypothetical protein